MMAAVAARELADGEVVFVGIGLPNLACNLARRTHAPNLVLIYESGAVGARLSRARRLLDQSGPARRQSDHRQRRARARRRQRGAGARRIVSRYRGGGGARRGRVGAEEPVAAE